MTDCGKIKAIFFDFMGTCLDWCSSVEQSLPLTIDQKERRSFALAWRVAYFRENEKRLANGLAVEDFDVTLLKTLDQILDPNMIDMLKLPSEIRIDLRSESLSMLKQFFNDPSARYKSISSWHNQKAWPDVFDALQSLRGKIGCEIFVHGNGTTRLQLDLINSSGLRFDLLFSSEMLEEQKPSSKAYLKALKLVKYKPQQCLTVAAHVVDLRGAKAVGMRTIYIHRSTDDIEEDLNDIQNEFDYVLNDMRDLANIVDRLKC